MTERQSRDRSRVTLIYDTGAREDDALERFQWVLPAVFLAASLILFLSVTGWYSPFLPVLIFAGVVVAPLSLVLLWKAGPGRRRYVVVTVAVLASFGVPLLAWSAGPYRAVVMWSAGDLIPRQARVKALGDQNETVAFLACEQLLTTSEQLGERGIRTALEYRPEVARRCLGSVREVRPERTLALSRDLHRQWFAGWMGDAMPEDISCEAAQVYVETAAMHGSEGVPELLLCSLAAPSERIRGCCGEALSGFAEDEAIVSLDPGLMTADLKGDLFRHLVRAVDVPASTLMGREPLLEDLSWSPSQLFHWTVHLGCDALQSTDETDGIALSLSRSIDTQCGLDVGDPLFSFSARNFVRRTCEEVVESPREEVNVMEWCEAARVANGETVLETARFIVEKARNVHQFEGLDGAIDRGDQRRRREAQALAEEEALFMERARNPDPADLDLRSDDLSEHMNRLRESR